METNVTCPQCHSPMRPEGEDSADLVAHTSSTSGVNVAAAAKHARDISDKVEKHGLLYTCVSCGYHDRRKPPPPELDTSLHPMGAVTEDRPAGGSHA